MKKGGGGAGERLGNNKSNVTLEGESGVTPTQGSRNQTTNRNEGSRVGVSQFGGFQRSNKAKTSKRWRSQDGKATALLTGMAVGEISPLPNTLLLRGKTAWYDAIREMKSHTNQPTLSTRSKRMAQKGREH